MSTLLRRLVWFLLIAAVVASMWARQSHRPELALYLGIIVVGGFLAYALAVIARAARAPELPPGVLRLTSISLGISVIVMAIVMFGEWIPTLVKMLILLLVLVVTRRQAVVEQ